MTEQPGEHIPTPRSKRIYVYWGVALTLLIAAGLFSWLVVVPVMQVRGIVTGVEDAIAQNRVSWEPQQIRKLGGPADAAGKIRLYLRMPRSVAPKPHVALLFLGSFGRDVEWVVPYLTECLKDEDSEIRLSAAIVLGYMGDPRALKPLIAALQDKNSDWLLMVVQALGEIGDADAVKPLVARVNDDESLAVAIQAREALVKIGKPGVGELIEALGEAKSARARLVVVSALGLLRDRRAVGPLEAVLKDEDEYVRQAAAEALKRIRDRKKLEKQEPHK